jgi:RNA polymerase sigma-B factor
VAERKQEHLLFVRFQRDGDMAAREDLVRRFLPLARRLARRYERGSEPLEDLVQVASVGLVKAIDRYETDHGANFSSYAVPTILGELKRYFRESTWALHVSRGTQERALAVSEASDVLAGRNGRSPTVSELACYLELSEEEVLDGLQGAQAYSAASLEEPHSGDEDGGATLAHELGAEDERYEQVEQRLAVAAALPAISERDRKILRLRFFDEMTQTQIAKRMGISQMQVSRRLRHSLVRLRALASPSDEVITR